MVGPEPPDKQKSKKSKDFGGLPWNAMRELRFEMDARNMPRKAINA